MSKHPNKYTSGEVYELCDRLVFAAEKHPECAGIMREAGRVLLNRQTIVAQVRLLTEGK